MGDLERGEEVLEKPFTGRPAARQAPPRLAYDHDELSANSLEGSIALGLT